MHGQINPNAPAIKIENENPEIVETLLQSGADPHGRVVAFEGERAVCVTFKDTPLKKAMELVKAGKENGIVIADLLRKFNAQEDLPKKMLARKTK